MDRLWLRVDKRALVVTAGCLVLWRMLDQISVVGITNAFINHRLALYSAPGFLPAIGPNSVWISSYSLASEGIAPYVRALVILSVARAISGAVRKRYATVDGRATLNRWARAGAFFLSIGSAYGWTVVAWDNSALPFAVDWSTRLAACLTLAGGTAVMIVLADALDEIGLGFGYGAILLYALGYVASEVHRLAGYFASTPSFESLYRPVMVWAAFTIGVTVASVAVLMAVRRLPGNVRKGRQVSAPVTMRLMMSGVLRPPQFTLAVLFVPTLVANYSIQRGWAQWFVANWSPYGPSLWVDAIYLLVETGLVVLFAMFVSAIDIRGTGAPGSAVHHADRLAVIGGFALAVLGVAAPLANQVLTQAANTTIPLSGFQVMLVVAVVLILARAIEGHRMEVPYTVSPSGLP